MSNKLRTAFIFPGQGAQYIGMTKDFFNTYPEARHIFEQADDLLKQRLSHLIFEGDEKELTETKNSQPAIYITSIAILHVLQKLFPELVPEYTAGLSLGEYTALTAASILSFEEGLPLVQHRGQFMHDACVETPGTMAVILGLDDEKIEDIVEKLNLPNDLWAANFNCPGQVVISGTKKGIEIGSKACLEQGAKRALPLQVHGAFHSGLMKSAQEKLRPYIKEAKMHSGKAKVVMNVTGDEAKSIDEIKNLLQEQVISPTRWHKGIRAIDHTGIHVFIEIGCGKTLAGMNKRIGTQATSISVEKIEDLAGLEIALKEIAAKI